MNPKVLVRYFKKVVIGLAGLYLSTGALAQKAECEVILEKPDSKPASGLVSIAGSDTTISDDTFLSPKTYILKNIIGIEATFVNEEDIVVAGNPTNDGNTKLGFKNYLKLEGIVTAYTHTGEKADKADIAFDNELSFSTKPGIIFVRYVNGQENKTFKIVNNSNVFNMQIVQEDGGFASVPAPQKPTLKSSKGAFSDNYSFSFTDATSNIENYVQDFTVTTGNKFIIDQILQWTNKGVKYSLNTNTDTKIRAIKADDATILDEQTTATGILPTQTITNRFDNEKGLSLMYKLMSPFTDTITLSRTQFKDEEFVIDTLRKGWFYVTINGNGQNYSVKKNGEVLVSGLVGQQSLFKIQGDQTSVDYEVTGSGLVTKVVPATINKGTSTQIVTLDPVVNTYSHLINGSALSNLLGKLIKDGTEIYIVKALGDTAKINVTSSTFSYSWTDNTQTTSVKIGSLNVPGHNTNEITANIDDNENAVITFLGKSYSLTQQVHVKNQTNEDVNNVKVSGGDVDVYTNTSGIAIFSKSNLSTDINNFPFANYATNASFTAPNIQTLNAIINSIVGTNPEVLKNVNQIYQHMINGTVASSIAGKLIKDGTEIYIVKALGDTAKVNTTASAFTYNWSDLNKTLNVDIGSLNVPGHSPKKITQNIGASANVGITFTGLIYSFTHPVGTYTIMGAPIEGATITGGDSPVTTGANGIANVVRNNLPSDINNLSLADPFYYTSLTIVKSGFDTYNFDLPSVLGLNLEKVVNLNKTPIIHDFYITVKDINGDKVTDLTQRFEFNGDGEVLMLTPDANGIIHVVKTDYDVTSTKVKISNSSVKYSDFMVFRPENFNLADTNYCQIQKWDGILNFAEMNLTGIPLNTTEYVSKEKVKVPDFLVPTYGDSISITDPIVRDMMGGRNMDMTTKFISRPGAEKIYVFQTTFNETTGLPIAQAQLDRAKTELDKILTIYTQNDGKKLVNTQFYLINSYSDPKWLEAQARDSYDNVAYTTFDNSAPYNGLNSTLTYSPNNKARIKNSDSRYSIGTTTGAIFEEIYQQFTNNKDPTQGTAIWVTTTTGEVTDFAKTMARLIYLLNQGTKTQ